MNPKEGRLSSQKSLPVRGSAPVEVPVEPSIGDFGVVESLDEETKEEAEEDKEMTPAKDIELPQMIQRASILKEEAEAISQQYDAFFEDDKSPAGKLEEAADVPDPEMDEEKMLKVRAALLEKKAAKPKLQIFNDDDEEEDSS